MSSWIHVSGVFNIDGVRNLTDEERNMSFEELIDARLGKEISYEDICWLYETESKTHIEEYLPLGSEGSLQKSICFDNVEDSINIGAITVFGNLRDCYDVDKYIEWFKKKCELFYIRQAVITVTNGWETKTWTYGEKENGLD